MLKYIILYFFIAGLGAMFIFDKVPLSIANSSMTAIENKPNNYNEQPRYTMPPLNPEEERVLLHKGTEAPYSGKFNAEKRDGTYICRQCGTPLFSSKDKFNSNTGWPSFDDEIANVKRVPDADGRRTEVVCNICDGHLGHVFLGEGFTDKNTRHCINSVSLDFVPTSNYKTAVFAGGCFWGVEANFSKIPGVLDVISGYSGGKTNNPTYQKVITGETGHAESVQVVYDSSKVDYKTLAKAFFEIHDPTQHMRQGPDVGSQYRSVLFYNNDDELKTAQELIDILKQKGYDVVTELTPSATFYPAEEYHQDFIKRTGRACGLPVKRFD